MSQNTLETHSTKVESFQTAYIEGGDPQRQSILLLHDGGFGTTGELCWGAVMRILAAKYHVVAPDLLGWGRSDKAVFLDRSPYAGRIDHIAAFLRKLDIESPVVVGASFGGSMALRAVMDHRNPFDASAAITFSGAGGPYRLRLDELGEYTPNLAEAKRLTEMLVTSLDGLEQHVAERAENSLIPGHWESLNAPRLKNPSTERSVPADQYEEQLRALTVPTLLVEGAQDTLVESGWAERVAAFNPGVLSALVHPHSHEPNIDHPELAAEIIDNYISARGL